MLARPKRSADGKVKKAAAPAAESTAHKAGPSTGFSSLLSSKAEIDFPRGGGTVLTPVEVREAKAEGRAQEKDLFASTNASASAAAAPASPLSYAWCEADTVMM